MLIHGGQRLTSSLDSSNVFQHNDFYNKSTIVIISECMGVFSTCICLCTCVWNAWKGQRWLDPLELKMVVSYHLVLGTKSGSSVREVSTLKH